MHTMEKSRDRSTKLRFNHCVLSYLHENMSANFVSEHRDTELQTQNNPLVTDDHNDLLQHAQLWVQ